MKRVRTEVTIEVSNKKLQDALLEALDEVPKGQEVINVVAEKDAVFRMRPYFGKSYWEEYWKVKVFCSSDAGEGEWE